MAKQTERVRKSHRKRKNPTSLAAWVERNNVNRGITFIKIRPRRKAA